MYVDQNDERQRLVGLGFCIYSFCVFGQWPCSSSNVFM
jgi:hypothetical protein